MFDLDLGILKLCPKMGVLRMGQKGDLILDLSLSKVVFTIIIVLIILTYMTYKIMYNYIMYMKIMPFQLCAKRFWDDFEIYVI